MKAAVFYEPGSIVVEDRPDPAPEVGEVVLRVDTNTLCGTDQRIYTGAKTRGVDLPRVLGHEFSGVVVAVGSEVVNLRPGDRAAVCPVVPCGRCGSCLRGAENACDSRSAFGYMFDGGLAEYVRLPRLAVDSGNVLKIDSDVSPSVLALAEPLSCCVNGNRRSGISIGSRVFILGGGPIGLMHLQLAMLAGAAEVVVSEPHTARRTLAEELGAVTINPSDVDPATWVRDRWGGDGADSVVVCVGVAGVAGTAISAVRRTGTVNLFAGFPKDASVALDLNQIHYDEIVLTGSTAMRREDYVCALRLIEQGRISLSQLITHELPLSSVEAGLNMVGSSDALKIAINPGQKAGQQTAGGGTQ